MIKQLTRVRLGTTRARRATWFVTVAVAAAAIIGLVAPTAASAASGGGCSNGYMTASGFSVSSCVSDNGLTIYATANARGTSTAGSCSMYIAIINNSGTDIADSDTQGCSDGSHNGTNKFELSGQYRGKTCVTTESPYFYGCIVSPWIYQ